MHSHPLGKIPALPVDFQVELKSKLKKKMDETADVEMAQDPPPSSEVQDRWMQAFHAGELDLNRHWAHWVPKIYSPLVNENCLTWKFNEEHAQEVLFKPIELFICNGNPEEVLEQLNHTKKHSTVCGRFFKNGEPTYSCRECGMDKTCVLCVECFKESSHRFHKYRMGTSGGGGCCDCGDVEAWKRDPFCALHQANTLAEDDEKGNLPSEVIDRTRAVFDNILWYTFRRLTSEEITDIKFDGEERTLDQQALFDHDVYCTILYNDEVHTFEQVINTLGRVLKCNQRQSTEFVTNIDREGRAVVRCSSFQVCSDLKHEIEKYTSRHGNKPLKVLVTHAHIIAHQIFSQKLLTWLEKFLSNGKGFRAVFSESIQKIPESKTRQPALLTEIMLKDSSLWKNARTQFHKLLIAGMLLEYENKKALAKAFTKNYAQIMKDFIRDDHEHSFSISSIAVQLYTVPTLAHHLIANDDVMYIILNTLISEYRQRCNKNGKLEFERNAQYQNFKRSLFMLYDLKYLLNYVPETWTDELKKNFLHGFSVLVNLLTMVQGMDSVTRQVGQHMEFEPEWESAFNLHLKLAFCISQIIEWCATDKVVLVKAYRLLLRALEENPCYDPNEALEVRELADHSTACLHYDVSLKPVTIHLPLSRLLAALHLYLEKFGLHFDSPELQISKPTPVQLIEPVLREQVMIAQVHAGMWRRNGYALLNTLYFYHNVKCRTEMLDRDIHLLQVGASLIESNEFLIHVLNKFNLINWALQDFEINTLKSPEEDSMRQTINLVEEFLHLLIVIIAERYFPTMSYVDPEERIKRDLLHSLCIKQMPHSELVKCVPEDLELEDGVVDKVIHKIAKFNKPLSSNAKGTYELLPEYYKEFNVYFYHYTREEMSKAEEAERARRKQQGKIACCPPPALPKLRESFSMIVNLLHCDVMLHIIQTVFVRCLNLRARSFSELQLAGALQLVGYGLQEEESGNYPFFKFVENASKFRIFELMEGLQKCPRVEAHKGLLQWTLNKYQQVAKNNAELQNQPTVNESSDALEKEEKERRAKLAAERRAKVMAQMAAQQRNFMKENSTMFEKFQSDSFSESGNDMDVSEVSQVALGPDQSPRVSADKLFVCILCQEEERITVDGRAMVLACFVHQATVLNQSVNTATNENRMYLTSNLSPAPHTSTCGHVMHSDCWRKFFDNVMVREHRRPYRLRNPTSFDVDKQEFLCPLCECLSNTVLPLVPPLGKLQTVQPNNQLAFSDYLTNLMYLMTMKTKVCHGVFQCDTEECSNIHCNACLNASNGSLDQDIVEECDVKCSLQPHQIFLSMPVTKSDPNLDKKFADLYQENELEISSHLQDMIRMFALATYAKGFELSPHPLDKSLSPMAWKSLAYTIHVIETITRYQGKPLLGSLASRHRDSIENLVGVVAVLGSIGSGCTSELINHALSILDILLDATEEDRSILELDLFGLLIVLTFSLPSLLMQESQTPIPTCGSLEWHSLRLIFIANIVKILVEMQPQDVFSENPSKDEVLTKLLISMDKYSEQICADEVKRYVEKKSLKFLRCCTLFYHYLTEISAPNSLQEVSGGTFENMCCYLGLPMTLNELFESDIMQSIVMKWLAHPEVATRLKQSKSERIEEKIMPRLIDLPEDYSELINSVSTFACPNNEEECRNPTLCLVCGETLCSQSYCCQKEYNKIAVGACNYHAVKCGAGVGVFLRIRDCELLLLSAPHRGWFITAPYLDEYGETDQGLRRGNPLMLNKEKYEKVNMMWLSHSVHEEIARQIEHATHLTGTQWNML